MAFILKKEINELYFGVFLSGIELSDQNKDWRYAIICFMGPFINLGVFFLIIILPINNIVINRFAEINLLVFISNIIPIPIDSDGSRVMKFILSKYYKISYERIFNIIRVNILFVILGISIYDIYFFFVLVVFYVYDKSYSKSEPAFYNVLSTKE